MAFRFRAFKHAEDRLPVACILALSALDFILSNFHLLGHYFFAMIVVLKFEILLLSHRLRILLNFLTIPLKI